VTLNSTASLTDRVLLLPAVFCIPLFTVSCLLFTIPAMSKPTHPHNHVARPARTGKGRSRFIGNGIPAKIVAGELPPPPIGALMNFRNRGTE